jgi:hypothetical protein
LPSSSLGSTAGRQSSGLIERDPSRADPLAHPYSCSASTRHPAYLAIQNAVPQWTRTRGWTKALLAFKIHFGDRLPD